MGIPFVNLPSLCHRAADSALAVVCRWWLEVACPDSPMCNVSEAVWGIVVTFPPELFVCDVDMHYVKIILSFFVEVQGAYHMKGTRIHVAIVVKTGINGRHIK